MLIKREQFDQLQKGYLSNLAHIFQVELIKEGFKNADKGIIEWIMQDCIRFHIKEVKDVLQYVKIAIDRQELQSAIKPDWACNILYTNGTPKARINALKRYISSSNKQIK